MPEHQWLFDKDGRQLGPFRLDQLRRLAAAGTVRPDDRVVRVGESQPTTAASITGLFPDPHGGGARNPTAPLLLTCEKCDGRLSDEADVCPGCGHPQPPLTARQSGEDLDRCRLCRTLNPVGKYPVFRDRDVCRGCGSALAEAHPRRQFNAQVDEAYRTYVSLRDFYHPWWAIAGVLVGAAVAAAVIKLAGWGREEMLLFGTFGAMLGYALEGPVSAEVYRRVVARRGEIRDPDYGTTLSADRWHDAAERHAQWEEGEKRAGRVPPGVPGWVRTGVWFAVGFVAVGWFAAGDVRTVVNAKRRAAESEAAAEELIGKSMTNKLAVRKSEGTFSMDVYLTNGSDARFGSCELTLIVFFETGKRAEIPRFWADWAAGEQKTVNFPSGGRVERVGLSGTVVNLGVNLKGKVDETFSWSGLPPAPQAGK
jgi:hypothetical protein